MVVKEGAGGFLVVVEPWRLVVILWRSVILWRRRLRMKLQGCVGVDDGNGGGAWGWMLQEMWLLMLLGSGKKW
jgi:hypothetical protein